MSNIFKQFERRSMDMPYRDGVAVVAVNSQGKVLMGEARGFDNIWKMPQGGVEINEDREEAALRELYEEFGFRANKVLRKTNNDYKYDYPANPPNKYIPGFRGQEFEWFMVKIGDNEKADLVSNTPEDEVPEFINYEWVTPEDAVRRAHNNKSGDHVTYQRQQMYRSVFKDFELL